MLRITVLPQIVDHHLDAGGRYVVVTSSANCCVCFSRALCSGFRLAQPAKTSGNTIRGIHLLI
jgi:hypothetical protein